MSWSDATEQGIRRPRRAVRSTRGLLYVIQTSLSLRRPCLAFYGTLTGCTRKCKGRWRGSSGERDARGGAVGGAGGH